MSRESVQNQTRSISFNWPKNARIFNPLHTSAKAKVTALFLSFSTFARSKLSRYVKTQWYRYLDERMVLARRLFGLQRSNDRCLQPWHCRAATKFPNSGWFLYFWSSTDRSSVGLQHHGEKVWMILKETKQRDGQIKIVVTEWIWNLFKLQFFNCRLSVGIWDRTWLVKIPWTCNPTPWFLGLTDNPVEKVTNWSTPTSQNI